MLEPGKVLFLILDGVGAGELPDAGAFGDRGSNTLGNTARAVGGLRLPHLEALGLGNILPIPGVRPVEKPGASWGKMAELSPAKDSTSGHWELCGLVVKEPFPVFPEGFPREVLERFLHVTGARGCLGNKAASGTAIIGELGEEHLRTGYPIVYTSADSVFQVAAHEDVMGLEELYDMCRRTRRGVCTGEAAVGRVIARPFTGSPGSFRRTAGRKDFSLEPPGPTVLDLLAGEGRPVVGIGKVDDLFAGRGLPRTVHTASNAEGLEALREAASRMAGGMVFANLVDFDTLYGHRNDPGGLARALEEFDAAVPSLLALVREADLLLITADHGNDPVTPSTDHSREFVPLLCTRGGGRPGVPLGVRGSYADAGKTVAEFFGLDGSGLAGTGFLSLLP